MAVVTSRVRRTCTFTCFEGFVPNPPVFASCSVLYSETNKVGVVGRFYLALGSALEQTQCAHMWFYMSD